jgi:hypothetical protein
MLIEAREMRERKTIMRTVDKLLRMSALAAMGAGLSFVVFFSNCGGSSDRRSGTGGTTGSATGTAGTQGSGGSGGSTGSAGVTGSGGRFTCPSDQVLNCSSALTLPDGHVTTFSPEEWSPTDGKYCNASGLRGSIFSYSGGGPVTADDGGVVSSNAQGVDAPAGNFRLTLAAGPGGYAGGGISFDRCINASAFNALRFSAWIASGDLTGCNFKSQLQTFEQRPTTQSPPGSCDPDAGSCYNFPTSIVTLGSTPQTFTIKFSDFTTGVTHANPVPGELVGLQWQIESAPPADPDGGSQLSCSVEIRIDDISFVTQ